MYILRLACTISKLFLFTTEYLVEVFPDGVLVRDKNGDTPLDLAKMPVHGKPNAELISYLELVEERMELETNTVHSNYDSNYDSQDDLSQHSMDKHYDSKAYEDTRSYASNSYASANSSYDDSDSEASSSYDSQLV